MIGQLLRIRRQGVDPGVSGGRAKTADSLGQSRWDDGYLGNKDASMWLDQRLPNKLAQR